MAQPTFQDLMKALDKIEGEWNDLQTHRKLSFKAEREWLLQACEKTEYACDAAVGNIDATCAALRNVAAVGVTLDPARKLAYVLPRDKRMVYDLSYMGLIDVAITSKAIMWAQAAIVYEKDSFELRGYDESPIHRRDPFAKDRGAVRGAYVVVKTPSSDYLTGTLAFDEIEAIRMRSPSGKKNDGPWNTDWDEMAKKSVVKNAYKYWPRSEAGELERAIQYLNTEGGQGIYLTPEDEQKSKADALIEEAKAATSGTAVATVWQKARTDAELKAVPDQYERVKAAVAERNRALGVKPPDKTGPVATPAPTPEPTPAPGAALSPEAALLKRIEEAPDFAALDATGPLIDALPDDIVNEFNDAYNQRLEFLKKAAK